MSFRWRWCVSLVIYFVPVGLGRQALSDGGTPGVNENAERRLPVFRFPGERFRGRLPELTEEQRQVSGSLRLCVASLAGELGERNLQNYENLTGAATYLSHELAMAGYTVELHTYEIEGRQFHNLIVERRGVLRPEEIVLLGAHYDSVTGSPGANDNGSGTAGLLELARRFAKRDPERTLRMVFFVNEEPPHFHTEMMGSYVYARRCKERKDKIVATVVLETIGYYSDDDGSQKYPLLMSRLFPTQGNFIGFVGNAESGPLVERVLTSFRKHAQFPSEGTAIPDLVEGVGWSDHWSFWQFGYQAVMVTDTAPFRYPHYHRKTDTPDKLDYDRMARVVLGVEGVVQDLVAAHEE